MTALARLALDHDVVECGCAVRGVVSWSGNDRHAQVRVVLRYRTQGRGDVDTGVADRRELGDAETGEVRFGLFVPPNGPVTYHGQLLRLLWSVAVEIPVRGFSLRDNPRASADVTVVPYGWPPVDPADRPR
jgi:hypothetical protein